jgi:hypothetical protein
MKLILDTNVHSDLARTNLADRPDLFDPNMLRRLEAIISHPDIELIVPGPMFMEFQWPRDKQERWTCKVVDIANSIGMLAEDPVAWDLHRLLAEYQDEDPPKLKIVHGSRNEILAVLGDWHPSQMIGQAMTALGMSSNAEAISQQARQCPEGVSKQDHRRQLAEKERQAAAIMSDPVQFQQLLEFAAGEQMQESIRQNLLAEGFDEEEAAVAVQRHLENFSLFNGAGAGLSAPSAPEFRRGPVMKVGIETAASETWSRLARSASSG